MKNIYLSLLLMTLAACSTQIPSTGAINPELTFKEIALDTYVVTDESYHQSNVMVARMPDNSVIIASSPFETQSADAIMVWIKKHFNPKKIIAINTHHHADGTGGNEAYQNHGVEIWASEMTRNLHQERGERAKATEAKGFSPELQKRIMTRKTVIAPNTFKEKDGKTFQFQNETVKVIYPGPAHTKDNVVVYLPERKVLFGGCMIKAGHNLGYLGDADITKYESSAQSLLSLDIQTVIPGHGKIFGGKDLIQNTVNLAHKAREAK